MGKTATCKAEVDGEDDEGQALLETAELVFRGKTRVKIPLPAITKLAADGGVLSITYRRDGRTGKLVLGLGAKAAGVWKSKIENPPSRLDKLGVKPGMTVAVWGTLDPDALAELQKVARVHIGKPRGGEAMVFLPVDKPALLSRLGDVAEKIAADGAIWVIRKKKTKTEDALVTEAESMAAGRAAGLVDTKVAAFSPTHTAERYVIPRAARKR
ncbi:MAG TPA: DUF3052 domain-containing protein [Polyangia bacterium]